MRALRFAIEIYGSIALVGLIKRAQVDTPPKHIEREPLARREKVWKFPERGEIERGGDV